LRRKRSLVTLPDLSAIDPEARATLANKIKKLKDVELPTLAYLNVEPCAAHETNLIGCRECGLVPRKHQRVAATWMFIRNKTLLADQTGLGKAMPLSAKVLTPSGWTTIGQLKVGDAVIDPEGEPSEITGVFPQGLKQTYQITFSDGTTAESCLEHLWKVRGPSGADGTYKYKTRVGKEERVFSTWKVKTLKEIKEGMESGISSRRAAVPLISAIPKFDPVELPLDPYLLGVLLGDGCLVGDSASFTSADQFIVDEVENSLPPGVKLVKQLSKKIAYSLVKDSSGRYNPLISALRDLEVWGHKSYTKFIPEIYKWASPEDRLALLQGLMDTDGNWSAGSAEFGSSSAQLAQDVADLARSLGLLVRGSKARSTFHTYKGERKEGATCYRIYITESDDFRVFRLPRKLKIQPKQRPEGRLNAGKRKHYNRRNSAKWIRSIEPIRDPEPHQCISVSAKSQLYVTDGWTVTHNTLCVATLIAMMAEAGELEKGRVVIVCRAAAVSQWVKELHRMLPMLNSVAAGGTVRKRLKTYSDPWDIMVIGRELFLKDHEAIDQFNLQLIVADDVDSLRNRKNRIAWALKRSARNTPRCVVVNATPLQKRLAELHSVLELVGGREIFGSETNFLRTYTRSEKVNIYARGGRRLTQSKVVGYQNIEQFKSLIEPLTLRRTAADLDDVTMPALNSSEVWLDLHPAQSSKYKEIQQGVLKIIKSGKVAEMTQLQAITIFQKAAAVCAGLATIGEDDGPGASSKLDWIVEQVTEGDLSDEKVVVFVAHKKTLLALQARLDASGVKNVSISGLDSNPKHRAEAVAQFWDDPECRVLAGTSALESSLNLQTAAHIILCDLIMNPARVTQLIGRIQRVGSAHSQVYVHTLLTTDTLEEGYMAKLETESALSDTVFDSTSEIFEALPPLALLQLIAS
jgi:hypothetical protein